MSTQVRVVERPNGKIMYKSFKNNVPLTVKDVKQYDSIELVFDEKVSEENRKKVLEKWSKE